MIAYKTIAGQSFPIGSIGVSDARLRIQSTTEDECREYAQLLESSGYCKCVEKKIATDSNYAYNTNLFYAFQNELNNLFLFWDASARTVFITEESHGVMPSMEECSGYKTKAVCGASVTQFSLKHGLCFVVQLENGEYILVDGGIKDEDAEARLYAFLRKNAPNEKPIIASWIFTHPHKDHIGLATEFIPKYKDLVEVQAFAYQFPNCNKIQVAMESVEEVKAGIEDLETGIKTCYPNAKTYTLHTGQSYFFAGVEIEILYSLDDTYPYPYVSFNDMSAAFRLIFKNGKTMMFLGDSQIEACKKIAERYGDYLKSDLFQLSHHGLIGGDKRLYQMIDPEICFWATSATRFLGEKPNQRYQWCIGEGGCDYNSYLRDDTIRKRIHYHGSATTTVKI